MCLLPDEPALDSIYFAYSTTAPMSNDGFLSPLHYRDADTFYTLPGASYIWDYAIYVAGNNGILFHIPPARITRSARRPVILK